MVKKGNIPWNKGKKDIYSEETKEKIRKSVEQLWKDDDYRNMQSESKSNSDAYKNKGMKQSITMKKLWENPEVRKEASQNLIKVFEENPQMIENMSFAKIKNWRDDDYREKQIISRKNSISYQNKGIKQRKTLIETYKNYPEIKDQISETLIETYKNHPEIKNQISETYIKNFSVEERSNRARKAGLASMKNQKSPSSIEIKMAEELTKENIYFIQQMNMLDKYRVDFLINDNIIVECDGDYWHNLPNIKEKDKIRDENLRNNGFIVLRFWEHEIKKDVSNCINKIKEYSI